MFSSLSKYDELNKKEEKIINLEEDDEEEIDKDKDGKKKEDILNEGDMENFNYFKERFHKYNELNLKGEKELKNRRLIIDNPIQFCVLVRQL